MLQTLEVLNLAQATVSLQELSGTLSLRLTKMGQQRGGREYVTSDDPVVVRLLSVQLRRHENVWPMSLSAFHSRFQAGCTALKLERFRFQPYSLRRGGATYQYTTSSLEAMLRGRWASLRTARIYITDGAAALAEQRLSPASRRLIEYYSKRVLVLAAQAPMDALARVEPV